MILRDSRDADLCQVPDRREERHPAERKILVHVVIEPEAECEGGVVGGAAPEAKIGAEAPAWLLHLCCCGRCGPEDAEEGEADEQRSNRSHRCHGAPSHGDEALCSIGLSGGQAIDAAWQFTVQGCQCARGSSMLGPLSGG